jgi:hypothetical protein
MLHVSHDRDASLGKAADIGDTKADEDEEDDVGVGDENVEDVLEKLWVFYLSFAQHLTMIFYEEVGNLEDLQTRHK